MENKDYLSFYSRFFKFVEVDSTYYNIPSRFITRGWKDKTPSDFRFALKFPKIITHEKKLEDVTKHLSLFFNSLEPLLEKTLMLLIQLPPYLTKTKGFESFKIMIRNFDNRFKYGLEVREPSWFDEEVRDLLIEHDISLVWSVRDELTTPQIITANQIYVRFIGNRSIDEKDFGHVVKDRSKELREFAKRLKEIQEDDTINSNVHDILIAFNNHFAGFGPQSVNDFLKIIDMPKVGWKDELEKRTQTHSKLSSGNHQSNLFDFNQP